MEKIRTLISNDNTGIALRTLLTEFQLDNEVNNLLHNLNARFNRLRKESIRGTISQEEKNLSLNKINNSILELLPEIEELFLDDKLSSIKYYLYYSETKLNMLYSQISNKECNDFQKLSIIENTLNRNNLVDSYPSVKKQFIRGKLKMNWGLMIDYASDIVFFGSKGHLKNLCLIGSRESMVGEVKRNNTSHTPDYYLFKTFNAQINNEKFQLKNEKSTKEENKLNKMNNRYFNGNETFIRFMKAVPNKEQELEFTAKILTTFSEFKNDLIIATPIYVSHE